MARPIQTETSTTTKGIVLSYQIKTDQYGLPINTKEYVLSQVEEFLDGFKKSELQDERADWETMAGQMPNPSRRIILYALRVANRNPEPDRRDQLLQLCRKFKTRQPIYWPRFLRERYQYARTKDFFAIDYNDIIWEYYAYEDELTALDADPDATGKVFDAAPAYAILTATMKELVAKMKAEEASRPRRRRGIVKE